MNERPYVPHSRRSIPSLFWPILLIAGGSVLLLSNLGYLPTPSWNLLWKIWPVFLIALGIDVMIGRRTVLGGIISSLLILMLVGGVLLVVFFARQLPALADLARQPALQHEELSHPLGDIEEATVQITWPSQPGELTASTDTKQLLTGTFDYYGSLHFKTHVDDQTATIELDNSYARPVFEFHSFATPPRGKWEVALHPTVELALDMNTGSGTTTLDLSELQLTALTLDAGSGTVELLLPETSTFSGQIDGGSGSLSITLPAAVGLRVKLEHGNGSFHAGERFRLVDGTATDASTWETIHYQTAEYQIELEIAQGSGSINVH
ncbi:MAG: DUF5668 domain-containing protein [Chloroflexota bacterium]|nr:DUF5668 domain-containing protein [Chloroflexota bacterium]